MYTEEPQYGDDSIKRVFESQSKFNNSQADLNVNFDQQLSALTEALGALHSITKRLEDRVTALESNAPTPQSPQS